MDGFRDAGMYPYNRDKVLVPAYDECPELRSLDMDSVMDELVRVMKAHGFVAEAEYDRLGIPKTQYQADIEVNPTLLNLNDRALRSQRVVHINSDGYLRYMREKAAEKAAAREAAAAAKVAAAAAKQAKIDAKEAKRKAAARRAAEQEKKKKRDAEVQKRQAAYDADKTVVDGDRCGACCALRERAETYGFKRTGWFTCAHCKTVYCSRCRGLMGAAVLRAHKARCNLKSASAAPKRAASSAATSGPKRSRRG